MFVGHYSVGFALKSVRPQVPLWVLLLAVQAVDVGWGLLVLAGIEKVRIVPGFLEGSPLDLYYMPYTHSLAATAVWCAAAALLYAAWRRADGWGSALVVAVAVGSHWVLDLLVHAPDLPLYDDTAKLGFGLWAWKWPELALELGLVVVAVAAYTRTCGHWARRAWILAAALCALQIGNALAPYPASVPVLAVSAIALYLAVTWGAWRVERAAH